MVKTLTFVKKKAGLSDEEFFARWTDHTRRWDLRDHPEITLNRLMLLKGNPHYTGVAENHWPDEAALRAAAAWYATPEGQKHWADLCSFMDIENSPTVIVQSEADVSADRGVTIERFQT